MTTYVLTSDHLTVHLDTCTAIARRPTTPWVGAAGKTPDEVRASAASLRLRPCTTCKPLGGAS